MLSPVTKVVQKSVRMPKEEPKINKLNNLNSSECNSKTLKRRGKTAMISFLAAADIVTERAMELYLVPSM